MDHHASSGQFAQNIYIPPSFEEETTDSTTLSDLGNSRRWSGHLEDMGTGPSDRELWALAANGDADAFGELYERHVSAIYNHSFRRTGRWSLAEDLTSAVFLEAWRHRRRVRFVGDSALPWLLGVATNLARNQQRTLRRHRAALERLSPTSVDDDFVDDLAGRLDDERTVRNMLNLLGRLPRRDQEVLALCAWDGLSYAEAAVALGVPVGTIRSRLSRARRRLERSLGEGGATGRHHEGEMGIQHER
jgi:RNA polymerase sigma factor (sigma-70 family)